MACNYLWTWRRISTTQYVLGPRWSVNVFSFANLKNRVMIIRVGWAFLNARGAFSSFLFSYHKTTNYSIQKRPK